MELVFGKLGTREGPKFLVLDVLHLSIATIAVGHHDDAFFPTTRILMLSADSHHR